MKHALPSVILKKSQHSNESGTEAAQSRASAFQNAQGVLPVGILACERMTHLLLRASGQSVEALAENA